MPTSAGSLSPRCPQQQNGQQKTKHSIEIPLVHRAGIFWARLGSLPASTLHPVPGMLWHSEETGLTHTFDKHEHLTGEIRNSRRHTHGIP
jgi:hypothetical protein